MENFYDSSVVLNIIFLIFSLFFINKLFDILYLFLNLTPHDAWDNNGVVTKKKHYQKNQIEDIKRENLERKEKIEKMKEELKSLNKK
jgi:hypothetical protein